jgi:hypothetical protein
MTNQQDTQQNKPTFIKRFLEWIGVKERLDTKEFKPPFVKEGFKNLYT